MCQLPRIGQVLLVVAARTRTITHCPSANYYERPNLEELQPLARAMRRFRREIIRCVLPGNHHRRFFVIIDVTLGLVGPANIVFLVISVTTENTICRYFGCDIRFADVVTSGAICDGSRNAWESVEYDSFSHFEAPRQ
jgi:hypothetical protein